MESEYKPSPTEVNTSAIESNENFSESVHKVRRFITDIWEHPLLDEKTREARDKGKLIVLEYIKRSNIDPSGMVALPIGSVLWNVDNKSDYDYRLIVNPDKVSLDNLLNSDLNYLKESKLHITDAIPANDLTNFNAGGYTALTRLVTTPDNYIVGDQEFFAHLRLNSLSELTNLEQGEQEKWYRWMARNFEFGYKDWMNLNDDKDPSRSRITRFQQKLDQRSLQTHVPDKWKNSFNNALKSITLPSLQTFAECFKQTHGRLELLPNRATGISS